MVKDLWAREEIFIDLGCGRTQISDTAHVDP